MKVIAISLLLILALAFILIACIGISILYGLFIDLDNPDSVYTPRNTKQRNQQSKK